VNRRERRTKNRAEAAAWRERHAAAKAARRESALAEADSRRCSDCGVSGLDRDGRGRLVRIIAFGRGDDGLWRCAACGLARTEAAHKRSLKLARRGVIELSAWKRGKHIA